MRNAVALRRMAGSAAVLLAGGVGLAQSTIQPVSAPTGPMGTILVLPFHEAAGTNMNWIGHAMQQDLVADLSRATHARVEGPASAAEAADEAAAIAAGRAAGAALVVYGQFQSNQGRLRLSGQVVDVTTGKPGGSVIATGSENDLFPLEDDVAEQLLRSLPPGWLSVKLPPAQGQAQAGPAPDGMTSVPTPPTTMPQQAMPSNNPQMPEYYSYNYPDYATQRYYAAPYYYYDAYPYSGYPYWYAYPYFGVWGGWGWGGWGYGHYYHGYGGHFHGDGFRGGGFGHGGGFHGGGFDGHGGGSGGRR